MCIAVWGICRKWRVPHIFIYEFFILSRNEKSLAINRKNFQKCLEHTGNMLTFANATEVKRPLSLKID